MTIFTPRGLKICLPVDYAFALMSRLYPPVHPIKVLISAEGIDAVPAFLATATSIVSFWADLSPQTVALATAAASITGLLLTHFRLVAFVPCLVRSATLFSYLPGFGITMALTAGLGYWMCGWQVAAAFVVGRFVGTASCFVLEFLLPRVRVDNVDMVLSESEINFLNAYLGHAIRAGVGLNLSVEEDELEESNWGPVFLQHEQTLMQLRGGMPEI